MNKFFNTFLIWAIQSFEQGKCICNALIRRIVFLIFDLSGQNTKFINTINIFDFAMSVLFMPFELCLDIVTVKCPSSSVPDKWQTIAPCRAL